MSDTQAQGGRHDFSNLPDLASRRVGGSVVGASDELFAERENLIKPGPPSYSAHTFGHKGQIYDGWETRRRREPGDDFALIRLGLPGVVDAWYILLSRWGTRTFGELLAPAIEIAERGVPMGRALNSTAAPCTSAPIPTTPRRKPTRCSS